MFSKRTMTLGQEKHNEDLCLAMERGTEEPTVLRRLKWMNWEPVNEHKWAIVGEAKITQKKDNSTDLRFSVSSSWQRIVYQYVSSSLGKEQRSIPNSSPVIIAIKSSAQIFIIKNLESCKCSSKWKSLRNPFTDSDSEKFCLYSCY